MQKKYDKEKLTQITDANMLKKGDILALIKYDDKYDYEYPLFVIVNHVTPKKKKVICDSLCSFYISDGAPRYLYDEIFIKQEFEIKKYKNFIRKAAVISKILNDGDSQLILKKFKKFSTEEQINEFNNIFDKSFEYLKKILFEDINK